ncbi:MAG: hypothetical protein B7Y56_02955 [Gallionellales bacterium 35-53-114]|jgi:putative chitinase|nr:MAG: hypothetical protein B7Y56_02955 [Gallionellales bacterium 35-53-114]OYZ65066.1 MAG: hypothetical protein B7Y04_00115 [Gallionellales bacterium 24-53-125]OZB07975.1 MAG: hypothetical protein B7X61_10565 [Gallionellales bacterium 39-52-133]HQS59715.1 hypothetical protein [Gallionellaceae bacterium]HQS76469.1 hypothetical protein [Gallionellaceae bacterium]
MITAIELQQIMECTHPDRARFWTPHLNAAMERFDIVTPLRVVPFLAQVGHESARLLHTREIWNPRQVPAQLRYDTRADLGNTKPEAIDIAARHGSTPGQWWKGHGLMQHTGYNNHLFCGQALGLDLLNKPELLEMPEHGAAAAGWFWKFGAGLNLGKKALAALAKYGLGHGVNLNDIADKGDFETITLCINGGMNGWEDRLELFERAKDALADKE